MRDGVPVFSVRNLPAHLVCASERGLITALCDHFAGALQPCQVEASREGGLNAAGNGLLGFAGVVGVHLERLAQALNTGRELGEDLVVSS